MSWRLLIDDEAETRRRPAITIEDRAWRKRMNLPPEPPVTAALGPWVTALDAMAAIGEIERRGMPAFISFDHDLGDGLDSVAVVKWIVETDMDAPIIPDGFAYEIHSGNYVGRTNLRFDIERYLRHRAENARDPAP
jgi:hypothetical protein